MLGIVDIPFEIVGHAQNSSRKPQKSLSGVCLPSGPVPYLLSPDSAINLFIVTLDVRDYAAAWFARGVWWSYFQLQFFARRFRFLTDMARFADFLFKELFPHD